MQFKTSKYFPTQRAFTFGLAWILGVSPLRIGAVRAAPAPLQFTDIAGRRHTLSSQRTKATVLVFVAHDCPISNAYAPEINRIAAEYAKRKVDFFVVYADSDLGASGAREHGRQFGYRVPLVLDAKHRLSSALGATATPEATLLSPSGQRLYLGRINNRYATWGKTRSRITRHDLRVALDEVLAGKPVSQPFNRAIGCFIPAVK